MRLPASFSRFVGLVSIAAVMCLGSAAMRAADKQPAKSKKRITYDEHIDPIFRVRCFSCHNASKKIGGLDMSSYSALRVGGSSGEIVEPGDVDSSYLWSLITHESQPYMPAKQEKMCKQVLDLIKAWIDGGALENAGSKFVRKKPKFDFALKGVSMGRPKVPPMPLRLGLEPVVKTKLTTAVTALATNPWSPLAAVAGQKQILLYNTQTLQLIGVLPYLEGIPHVLKFSRNGSLLLAGGGRGAYKGLVVVFDVKTGKRVFQVGDELDTVLGADISADQSLIALGSSAKVVRVYSTKDGELIYEIPKKHTDWIYCCAFSPDGVLLATGDRAGGVFVWEAETGRSYLTLRAHGGAVAGLSWRTDSNILASCGRDSTIRLWEMENGRQVKNWSAHGGGAESVEFCRNGNLVSCGRDRVTKLWNQGGGQIRAFPAFGDYALRTTYCDETKRVISGDVTGTVRVWNAADGKQLGELSTNPRRLAERLEAATKQLSTREAAYKSLTAANQVAQAAAAKAKVDRAAAQKSLTDLTKQATTAANALKQATESIKKLTAERVAVAKAVAALQSVIPLLAEATTKGQQAAAKVTDDKELAALATQLKTQLDKKKAALTATNKIVSDKTAALEKAKKQLASAEKRVVALTPAVKLAEEKAAAAKQAADAAAQSLAAAKQKVDRWKGEIGFQQKLRLLNERRAERQSLSFALELAQADVDAARAELTKASQAVPTVQTQALIVCPMNWPNWRRWASTSTSWDSAPTSWPDYSVRRRLRG